MKLWFIGIRTILEKASFKGSQVVLTLYFYLPEQTGAVDHKQLVTLAKYEDVSEHVVVKDYSNEYSEYFDYVMDHQNLIQKPKDWQTALNLYRYLVSVM